MADSSAQGRWDAGLLHPSLDLGDGKRGAGERKGGQRGPTADLLGQTAVLGPGLCLTWQATPHLCLFVQMSSELQSLLLQPQLPHPITVLTEPPTR